MNFLIDNPLSPRVAAGLRDAGHEAVHVLDYQMEAATDEAIFDRAASESRVVVSIDTEPQTRNHAVTPARVLLLTNPAARRGSPRHDDETAMEVLGPSLAPADRQRSS